MGSAAEKTTADRPAATAPIMKSILSGVLTGEKLGVHDGRREPSR
jgi:hypothetical protein